MLETCHLIHQTGLATIRQGLFATINRKPSARIFSFLILFSVLFFNSLPTTQAEETDFFEQQKLSSHLLINLFLEKLDQGGLVIFEHTIGRSDLETHQVAYVHTIADDSLFVRLCFKLKKKILVPKFENYHVDRITIETNTKGDIIQVKSHVSPIKKEDPKQ